MIAAPAQAGQASANCDTSQAPLLCKTHFWVARTHHAQDVRLMARTPYRYAAERSVSTAFRTWVRDTWYHRWQHVHKLPVTLVSGVPAWAVKAILCIHPKEERSWSTSAGGLGLLSSPAAFAAPSSMISAYGNTWYAWPWKAQVYVAYRGAVRAGWRSMWPVTSYGCV